MEKNYAVIADGYTIGLTNNPKLHDDTKSFGIEIKEIDNDTANAIKVLKEKGLDVRLEDVDLRLQKELKNFR
jgi:hypothetical protein